VCLSRTDSILKGAQVDIPHIIDRRQLLQFALQRAALPVEETAGIDAAIAAIEARIGHALRDPVTGRICICPISELPILEADQTAVVLTAALNGPGPLFDDDPPLFSPDLPVPTIVAEGEAFARHRHKIEQIAVAERIDVHDVIERAVTAYWKNLIKSK